MRKGLECQAEEEFRNHPEASETVLGSWVLLESEDAGSVCAGCWREGTGEGGISEWLRNCQGAECCDRGRASLGNPVGAPLSTQASGEASCNRGNQARRRSKNNPDKEMGSGKCHSRQREQHGQKPRGERAWLIQGTASGSV